MGTRPVFGRVRRAVEVQRAETAASAADVRAVRIAIAGEVARAYVDLRGSQERLRIAARTPTTSGRRLR
nr:TolC family protein [Burkholderia ubonensis]